jgi:hypothetical protein
MESPESTGVESEITEVTPDVATVEAPEKSFMPESEGIFMMERIVPAFLDITRAIRAGDPNAETMAEGLIGTLRENGREAKEKNSDEGVWTATAELFRAVFTERQDAMALVKRTETYDKHPGYAWKTLCTLCYLGGSVDPNVLPKLAVNLHMGVAEFVCRGTMHMPDVYEQHVVGWFDEYWARTFENARFRFHAPRFVEIDFRVARKAPLPVRVQRILRAAAFGLNAALPERGREWFILDE